MNTNKKIEILRLWLVNAANLNLNKMILQKINGKLDQYIVEYYRKENVRKGGQP
ncbi:MAG: Spo0E family sporulation regulatory protein-aspartic acid phosphatase [Syntrophomonadaceae bacterium]|nr:Spo0E family sporulation regulatory protein-aspartic acid phosphatase [Syntrophomonadaceae bacterium]